MRPLVEKSAGPKSAKKSGETGPATAGFEKLSVVLQRKSRKKDLAENPLSSGSKECSSNLETVIEEGVVKKIIVRCTCGEVIEIDCDYGD